MMGVPDGQYVLDLIHTYFSIEYGICVAVGSLCWSLSLSLLTLVCCSVERKICWTCCSFSYRSLTSVCCSVESGSCWTCCSFSYRSLTSVCCSVESGECGAYCGGSC